MVIDRKFLIEFSIKDSFVNGGQAGKWLYDRPMSKIRRNVPVTPQDEVFLRLKPRKAVPYEFVLDAIAAISPRTNPMFGCLAVYVEDKIVLILRDRRTKTVDNGVWLATTEEHHESLRREFPCMRSIRLFGKKVTGWQVLPADALDFEETALHACELILAKDPRIGKVPKGRRAAETGVKSGQRSLRTKTRGGD
jgi:hypothetical protein